ncbi:MAG: CPBP family intramembrane metalloprotease [Acidobacteria bacterium]|nr:CPBP family intramembrane metalloprotease [Acidobacteriota bacterium]
MPDNNPSPADPIGSQTDTKDPLNPETDRPVSSPGPSQRPWTIGVAVAWLLIFATIAIMQKPQSPDRQPAEPDSSNDLTIQLMGRYAVGMKSFLGNARTLEYFKPQLEEMLQRSDNSRNHLSLIPILAELGSREDALQELNRLRANPPNKYVALDVPLFQQLYQQGISSLSLQQRRDIEGYGWVGKLALSQNMAPSDPARRAIVQSALKTFFVIILFTVLIVAALLAGFVLLITAIALRSRKRLRTRFSAARDPGRSLLEAFAVYIFGFLALPVLARWLLPDYPILPSLFLIPAVSLALIWPSVRGSKWSDVRKAMGWTLGQGFFREAGSGIIGYIAGLPLIAVSTILVLAISRSTGTTPTHPIVNEIQSDPFILILLFGLASIWAPVVEETFFRGALFGYLRLRWSWPIASALTGFLFAVIHPQGWVAVPALTTIGFILGAIREWRGSIIAPMTAHALNNGTVLLLAIFALT